MSGPLLADRVMETTQTTGTGALSLSGAVGGYRTFSAGVGNANSCHYVAEAVDSNGVATGDWEVGTGTYTASGSSLSRDSVIASSNSGSAVSFAAGTKRVFVGLPAEVTPFLASGVLAVPTLSIPNTTATAANLLITQRPSVANQWMIYATGALLSANYCIQGATTGKLAQFVVFDRDPGATADQCYGRFQMDTSGNLRLDANVGGSATLGSLYLGLQGNDAWRVWLTAGKTRLEGATGSIIVLGDTTDSTTTATGSLLLSGGVGVAGSVTVGGWYRGGSGAARTTTAPTNLTNVMSGLSDMTETLVAGRKYVGRCTLIAKNSTGAEGLQFDFNGGTATMTSFQAIFTGTPIGATVGVATASALGTALTCTAVATTDTVYSVYLTMVVNAGGTFIPRFAENSAHTSGTATVEIGSSLVLRDCPN